MAITIQMLLDALGVIQSAKETSEAVGEVADNFDALGDTSLDATDRAKLALKELYQVELDQARLSTQVYSDMTKEQREQFRQRFETEDDFYRATQELWKKREDAERAVLDSFRQEYERTFEDVERVAEDSSDKIGDTTEKGFERAGDAAKDTAGTVTDTLGDALGSLDGTAQGAADGAVGALRGLAGLIPGIGALIGAGLATVAAPLVKSFFDSAEESEDRIQRMYDQMLDSGLDYLTEKQLQEQLVENLSDETMRTRAQAIADYFKIPFERAMVIITENGDEAKALLGEIDDIVANSDGGARGMGTSISQPLIEARAALRDVNGEYEQGLSKVQETRRALDFLTNPIDAATDAASETNAELDRLASPRAAAVELEVDINAAEAAVQRFISSRRRLAVEIGLEQGGRIIR